MLLAFAVTLFTSAFLLFWVQPMFAKAVLPLLGGAPAVWNTCMVFYQIALLAGYMYAHISSKVMGLRGQFAIHAALFALSVIVLPVGIPAGIKPPAEEGHVLWVIALMGVGLGLPFFIVSATAPMLQRWFSMSSHRDARDPYFLYSASNAGSLTALLAYPVLIEPMAPLKWQLWMWSVFFLLLAALIGICAVYLRRYMVGSIDRAEGIAPPSQTVGAGRLRWIVYSFVPSSLLLGVTSYITTDIASVPLLWVIPLALYLLTFVIAFGRGFVMSKKPFVSVQMLLIYWAGVFFFLPIMHPVVWVVHLGAFFVTVLILHSMLAEGRPEAGRLTEFYICISLGGSLGGIFNAVLAPLIFDSVAEYPLMLVLSCLLIPSFEGTKPSKVALKNRLFDILLPTAFLALLMAFTLIKQLPANVSTGDKTAAAVFVALAMFFFRKSPLRFGLALGALIIAGGLWGAFEGSTMYRERTFFGVLRVEKNENGMLHTLVHNTTKHGVQSFKPEERDEPLAYYHRNSPIGQVFREFSWDKAKKEVAVIGLGAGSLAAYAEAGQHWSFYEIDPSVERIARNPEFFTYLKDCRAAFDVIIGDARLSIAEAPGGRYGMIIVDAFSSDSIPVHLITREALMLYISKLQEGGVMAFHVSNRHLDILPVLRGFVVSEGLAGRSCDIDDGEKPAMSGIERSLWVIIARRESDLGGFQRHPLWKPIEKGSKSVLWTDDYSNILGIMKLKVFGK